MQDPHGRKMSKSKGNAIAPQEVMNKFSADALRYFVTNVSLGEDYPYKEQELVRGTKLMNKLWNAARFIEMQESKGKEQEESIIDKCIINELNKVIKKTTKWLDKNDYANAKREIINFFWGEIADYYIEMIKYRLYSENQPSKNAAIKTLKNVYKKILKMIGIYMPFITEEVWRKLYNNKESIHNQLWPTIKKVDEKIEKDWIIIKEIISKGRQYKVSNQLSLGAELEELTITGPEEIKKFKDIIKGTLRANNIKFKKGTKIKVTQ
jgi:valyl-tRNA synthetase